MCVKLALVLGKFVFVREYKIRLGELSAISRPESGSSFWQSKAPPKPPPFVNGSI